MHLAASTPCLRYIAILVQAQSGTCAAPRGLAQPNREVLVLRLLPDPHYQLLGRDAIARAGNDAWFALRAIRTVLHGSRRVAARRDDAISETRTVVNRLLAAAFLGCCRRAASRRSRGDSIEHRRSGPVEPWCAASPPFVLFDRTPRPRTNHESGPANSERSTTRRAESLGGTVAHADE